MNHKAAVLEVKGLRVSRGGAETVNVPSFSLFSRETVALIGPNGSGKSSFLLSLACLLPSAEGDIFFNGELINRKKLTEYRRSLAMVFQEPLLFDTTVYKNVASGLIFRSVSPQEIRKRVESSMERFRISHLAERSARKLSGGEAQRTSLARAFATSPVLLLLDEPFAALDPPTRKNLTDDLALALRESEIATVMATHDQFDALYFADRLAVMQKGAIVQMDATFSVVKHPVNEFAAAFAGMENILKGSVLKAENGMFSMSVGNETIQVTGVRLPGEQVTVCIRPEQITLANSRPDRLLSGQNQFLCRIVRIITLGLYSRVYLECGFVLVSAVANQTVQNLELSHDGKVYALFDSSALHLLDG